MGCFCPLHVTKLIPSLMLQMAADRRYWLMRALFLASIDPAENGTSCSNILCGDMADQRSSIARLCCIPRALPTQHTVSSEVNVSPMGWNKQLSVLSSSNIEAHSVDIVNVGQLGFSSILKDYISVGRPVLLRGYLQPTKQPPHQCETAWRRWDRHQFVENGRELFSLINFTVYDEFVARSDSVSMEHFLRHSMSSPSESSECTEQNADTGNSSPYIIQLLKSFLPNELANVPQLELVSNILHCIPKQFLDYLQVPCPAMPGAYAHWTLTLGPNGSGAPMHMVRLSETVGMF